MDFTKASHRDDPQSDKVPCGFSLTIRCERASTVLNGLPRLVERGGQDADFFGIEDARLGVSFQKGGALPRQALFASAGQPISERHIGPLVEMSATPHCGTECGGNPEGDFQKPDNRPLMRFPRCLKRYDGLRATITQCDSARGAEKRWPDVRPAESGVISPWNRWRTRAECSREGHGYAWRSSIPRHRFARPETGSPMRASVVYAPAARRATFSRFANVLERVQAYA